MTVASSWRINRPSRIARRKSSIAFDGSDAAMPRATHDLANVSWNIRLGICVSQPFMG